jgi:hypothetical protein
VLHPLQEEGKKTRFAHISYLTFLLIVNFYTVVLKHISVSRKVAVSV